MNKFGFIKQAAQKAGKKMHGYGQQAGQRAGQFAEKHPIATAGGILGGTYAVGQTDMWQHPENFEEDRVLEWLEKPWDENSGEEAAAVYERYIKIFKNRLPNATREEFDAFSMELQKSILRKPGAPEELKERLYSINKQFSRISTRDK